MTDLAQPSHVAIVTGANHGIGAAVARRLAQRGVAVLVTYLRVDDPPDRECRTRTAATERPARTTSCVRSARWEAAPWPSRPT